MEESERASEIKRARSWKLRAISQSSKCRFNVALTALPRVHVPPPPQRRDIAAPAAGMNLSRRVSRRSATRDSRVY